jgi:hypothetical protein
MLSHNRVVPSPAMRGPDPRIPISLAGHNSLIGTAGDQSPAITIQESRGRGTVI